MKSRICIALIGCALIGIHSDLFAGAATCVEDTKASLYMPNDEGFLEAISKYNAMFANSKAGLQSPNGRTWAIDPKRTNFVKFTVHNKACGLAPTRDNSVKYMDCSYVGCNEPIGGLEGLSPGATLTATNCGSTYIYTSTTWTKQGDGSWTVTIRQEEQRTQCDPEG